jgi:O-antigen/teichoic acid export membrane protein
MFIFPEFLIKTFASAKYLPIIPVLHAVILFSFIRPFFYLFGTAMDAIGKPSYSFWVMILQTPVHLFLVSEGLTLFGWMGSAFGSVTGGCITFTVICIILKKTLGIRFKRIAMFFILSYRDVSNLIVRSF